MLSFLNIQYWNIIYPYKGESNYLCGMVPMLCNQVMIIFLALFRDTPLGRMSVHPTCVVREIDFSSAFIRIPTSHSLEKLCLGFNS